ncbi:MAG: helix-turn-helix transcriptional regulator [Deltaproteobacteria bacterium]|nr:helix-turn-helix transcriptional regulator [Deltaproteobacteria bacterium]
MLGAATEFFEERDTKTVSINAIARRAGLSKSDLHRYFASREEILADAAPVRNRGIPFSKHGEAIESAPVSHEAGRWVRVRRNSLGPRESALHAPTNPCYGRAPFSRPPGWGARRMGGEQP